MALPSAGCRWTAVTKYEGADSSFQANRREIRPHQDCHYRDNLARALNLRGLCWTWAGGQPNGQRVWRKCA